MAGEILTSYYERWGPEEGAPAVIVDKSQECFGNVVILDNDGPPGATPNLAAHQEIPHQN